MSGHNKWSKVKHIKARVDAKKGKVFGRFAQEITIAARDGGGDPDLNPRLRTAIDGAKGQSMPKENIERAIKKSQDADGAGFEEVRYEGFATGGVGIIVETLTDNRNRTAGDVRAIFTKHGGNLGETGSVSFMFDRSGLIEYPADAASEEEMFEAAIEAGAEDCVSSESGHELYCPADELHTVAGALEERFGEPSGARIVWRPQNLIPADAEAGEKVIRMIDALEDNDDVQNVYANFDISDEVLEKMSA
jgi:YebC/PmpR family DNA-binding regulatory protein